MSGNTGVKFVELADLQALTDEQLAALWDQVPTERQRLYKSMYDRELNREGVSGAVGSDALEKQVLESLLYQYQEDGLVPAGEVWVPAPQHIRTKAKSGEEAVEAEQKAKPTGPKPAVLVGGGILVVLALFMVLSRGKSTKAV